jgi:hypothetical protein
MPTITIGSQVSRDDSQRPETVQINGRRDPAPEAANGRRSSDNRALKELLSKNF